MSIVRDYQVDQTVIAPAQFEAAAAVAAEQQRRALEEQAEQRRQFDAQLDFNMQEAALRDRLARSRLYQDQYQFDRNQSSQDYQFDANQAFQAQQFQANNQLQWANADLQQQGLFNDEMRLAQQAQADALDRENALQRQQMIIAAEKQRRMDDQRMADAIREQTAIEKFNGWTSPKQRDEAIEQWEQRHNMTWGYPRRAVAEQDGVEAKQKRQQFVASWATLTGLDPGVIDGFTKETPNGPELTVPPQVILSRASDQMSDKRMRDKARDDNIQKEKDREANNATAGREVYAKSMGGYAKYKAAFSKFKAREAEYNAKMAVATEDEKKLLVAPVPPSVMEFAGDIPVIQTPEEAALLPKGTIFLTPEGELKKVP